MKIKITINLPVNHVIALKLLWNSIPDVETGMYPPQNKTVYDNSSKTIRLYFHQFNNEKSD